MAITQNIPVTTIAAGTTTFNVNPATSGFQTASVVINRTGSGSHPWLNTLTSSDSLGINPQYSIDGGATWIDCSTITVRGGTMVTKGITLTTEEFDVDPVGGGTFPVNCQFLVNLIATSQTTISGTVTYE